MTASTTPTAERVEPTWRRWLRRGALGGGALAALTAVWWGPLLLASLAFFHVRRVEIEGLRYTQPDALMRELAIDTMASVWEAFDSLEAHARAHPMIIDARARRRLPNTVILEVLERTPIALVAEGQGLVAVDAFGERLPLDPAGSPIDVPIVGRRDSALLGLLDRIREGAPSLWLRLSEATLERDGTARLELHGVTVRARTDVTVARLGDIFPVEADLARRRLRAAELDVRFRDQVIARLP